MIDSEQERFPKGPLRGGMTGWVFPRCCPNGITLWNILAGKDAENAELNEAWE